MILSSFGLFLVAITPEVVEGIIKAAIVIFAILLLAVSLSAYRRLKVKKMAYAAGAFSLFAIQLLYEYFEQSYHLLDMPYPEIVLASMTLGTLVLFFIAILKKDRHKVVEDI